eukprot:scaffold43469_cov34-Tisochrysis_lutea.AAC.3
MTASSRQGSRKQRGGQWVEWSVEGLIMSKRCTLLQARSPELKAGVVEWYIVVQPGVSRGHSA